MEEVADHSGTEGKGQVEKQRCKESTAQADEEWTERKQVHGSGRTKGEKEAIEVRSECGKGVQLLEADKQQSAASCVSSLRLNNKTAQWRKKEQNQRDERGEEEETSGL